MTNTINLNPKLNKSILKIGSQGKEVKELQKLLYSYGAFSLICNYEPEKILVDGIFGETTKATVIAFQDRVFLKTDGIVADKTWRALYKGAPVDMPEVRRGSANVELVKIIQTRLLVNFDYEDAVDGSFGIKTELGVKSLQKRTSLPITGVVNERTWFELSKLSFGSCEGC
jgi:peptidoglycan hydrolase-like protein with peptidoglycan-binding domain